MGVEFSLPEGLAELEAELLRFGERELRARMREAEEARAWDEATIKALDAFGVPALDLPEGWGGAGAGMLGKTVALEAVAWGDAGGLLAADQPGVAAAACLACPDHSGQVVAAGVMARGDRCALVVGSRPGWIPGTGAPRWTWVSDGETLRLLETDGCAAEPAEPGAFHASGGAALDLAGAGALGEWALGPDRALWLRGRARLWHAAVALGIARAAFDYGVAYAKDRVVMGKPVAHHQANAFLIAEQAGVLEAARASVRAAARRIDDDEPEAGLWATLAWLDATDAAVEISDMGVQLLGGHGYIEDHPAEKWYREARALAQLCGGRDAALEDAASRVLDAPDPWLP